MESMEWALQCDLILQALFRHCAAGNDRKTLLSLKAVCKLWNVVAKYIFNKRPDLIPWMKTASNVRRDFDRPWSRCKLYTTFTEVFPPSCGLHIKLFVREWTPTVIQFLKEYSADIHSVQFRTWTGLSLGEDSFNLPRLKNVFFEYIGETYGSPGCQNAILLLHDIIKMATLKRCHVSLQIEPGAIEDSGASLPPQMTSLSCDLQVLENLLRGQQWPKLEELEIDFPDDDGSYSGQFLEKVGGTVKKLSLHGSGMGAKQILRQIPLMRYLTHLELSQIVLTGNGNLAQLLPNLQNIQVSECEDVGGVLTSLTQGGHPFPNVVRMTYYTEEEISVGNLSLRMAALCNTFPNITQLNWSGSDTTIAASAHILFSNLEKLETLRIRTRNTNQNDIVKMLTGRSRGEIPHDDSNWTTALEGNEQNTILNLKKLKKLVVGIDVEDDVLPARESNFLFTAAFFQMESLELVKFPEFRVDSAQVKDKWESTRGRKLIDKSNLGRRFIGSGEWAGLSREQRHENEFEYLH